MPTVIDLKDSTTVLRDAAQKIGAELSKRDFIETAKDKMVGLIDGYSAATDRVKGKPWVRPIDVLSSYSNAWTVTHKGKTWVSLADANVWEPGLAGWREVVAEGVAAGWVQPLAAFDAYKKGDRVTYLGNKYTSLRDANVWAPSVLTAWRADPTSTGVPEWKRPAGAHDAYKKGDRVLWQGLLIESTMDANVWSPDEYPQAWRAVGTP